MSTQVTLFPLSAKQVPVTSPTYPVPIMANCIPEFLLKVTSTAGQVRKLSMGSRRTTEMRRKCSHYEDRRRLHTFIDANVQTAATQRFVAAL